MKRFYLNFYEFVWFWVSRHCLNMFNQKQNNQSEAIWIEELGCVVEHELEKSKEKRCFINLCQVYIFALNCLKSVRDEGQLRQAKHFKVVAPRRIKYGKYVLIAFLMVNTILGIWITYSYQASAGEFNLVATLIAAIIYVGMAWGVLEARATSLFKLTLLLLIALISLNTLFWPLWQNISNSSSCYSEVCTLLNPKSPFQAPFIKLPLLIFWLSFFAILSLKTPLLDYLNYKQSLNRKL